MLRSSRASWIEGTASSVPRNADHHEPGQARADVGPADLALGDLFATEGLHESAPWNANQKMK